ncbi:MAG: flagellar basal body-associated FliL family protein [Methylococcales bacterium]|nr:flagellar basal body-associated FliL family protein [Methylococcales bacterium]
MRCLILWLSFFLVSNFVYAGEDGEEGETEPMIEYIEMSPKFTVNLDKKNKYLVVNVQLMVEGEKYIDKVKKHLPALRHQLIMLYSGRSAAELQTMEQHEELRKETRKVIFDALDKQSNSDGFRDVYFTEFLVN